MARVLFVTLEAQAFLNQRLALAEGLRNSGHEVAVATQDHPDAARIRALGFPVYLVPFNRKGKNIINEWGVVRAIRRVLRDANPDVVLGFALKPSLYGSLATLLPGSRRPMVIGTITGLGYVYTEDTLPVRVIRIFVNTLFFTLARLTKTRFAFQNDDDYQYFRWILPAGSRVRVPGSGIDCEVFSPGEYGHRVPANESAPLILFPARMLRHKGVYELIEAIPMVRQRHPGARFQFLGSPDPSNPASVPESEFQSLMNSGAIEWIPTVPRARTIDFYRKATIVCLPSYREGLPMALMEAAACGAPLVATDVPGCREVCIDGVTGKLVPSRDAKSLADAIAGLLSRPEEAAMMGDKARQLILEKFSIQQVLLRYQSLLS